MPPPFSGTALPMTVKDLAQAATVLGCRVEMIQAVRTVETGGVGGFLSDGSNRPRILCEARHFGDDTKHVYDAGYPLISTRINNYKLYKGGAAEYDRLQTMVALNRTAGLSSTSWGLFQVMGGNWKELKYPSLEDFVARMAASEGEHLQAFVRFCVVNGLQGALRREDCTGFAERYNGADQAAHNYSGRLQSVLDRLGGAALPVGTVAIGDTGDLVSKVQAALHNAGYLALVDGAFGRITELAVRRFQSANGLTADGVAGPMTCRALGVSGPPSDQGVPLARPGA